jgi:SAM-dependent methyltransferase
MQSCLGLTLGSLRAGCDPNQILVKLALRRALLGCDEVLDVGCGISPSLRELGVARSVGAEAYAPSAAEARRRNLHDEIVECDVRHLSQNFKPKQFDACIAMDVIEHLTKADGLKLVADMEKLARKRVIFFTPSGFLKQGHTDSDDLQQHLSGWEPAEMEQLGYQVIGLLGPKSLRGEYHRLKRRPDFFWGLVSLAGQCFWSKCHPQDAAAILCVKKISDV